MKVVIAFAFGQLIEKVRCYSYAKYSKWGFVAENLNDVSAYNSINYYKIISNITKYFACIFQDIYIKNI